MSGSFLIHIVFLICEQKSQKEEVENMSKNGLNVGRGGTQEVKAPKGGEKVKKPRKEKGGDLRAR